MQMNAHPTGFVEQDAEEERTEVFRDHRSQGEECGTGGDELAADLPEYSFAIAEGAHLSTSRPSLSVLNARVAKISLAMVTLKDPEHVPIRLSPIPPHQGKGSSPLELRLATSTVYKVSSPDALQRSRRALQCFHRRIRASFPAQFFQDQTIKKFLRGGGKGEFLEACKTSANSSSTPPIYITITCPDSSLPTNGINLPKCPC